MGRLMSAYDDIRHGSLRLIEDRSIDPRLDSSGVEDVVREMVEEYQERAHLGEVMSLRDPSEMESRVLRSILEFGPLTDLLSRPDVEEVFIEGPSVRYLDGSGALRSLAEPVSGAETRHVVDRLLAASDRRLDASTPIVQARVLDGTARLTAVAPPIAETLSATIRRFSLRRQRLGRLVELGSLSPSAAGFLRLVMASDASIIVSGQPGAGKTSMLSALIDAIPSSQCVRCCEEVRELSVPLVHGSYYETRPPSLDGSGEIDLRMLVKSVLAMRPDRIVVGEVRGSEAFELTRAVNAGCGFAGTIHANAARDALNALVNAALMAGENVTEDVVQRVFASSLDFVVHLSRTPASDDGIERRVEEILTVLPAIGDGFTTEPIFERVGGALEWTGALPSADVLGRLERGRDVGSVAAILRGAA
jgi:pilus assembly protein CpaF